MKTKGWTGRFFRSSAAAMLLSVVLMGGGFGIASASALDGVGSTPQTTAPSTVVPDADDAPALDAKTQENVDAVGGLFQNVGVDKESADKANTYVEPMAKWANIAFAVLIGFAGVGLFVITALDMVYIAVPPLRGLLYPAGQQAGSGGGGGMGGMGMGGGYGGMGGGYGGMGGMGGMGGGGGQASGGALSGFMSRLISDEAVAATAQMTGGQQGGGMGGMGGGFGGGFGGMGGQQEPPKMKSVLVDYMKKRALFLVLFGVCAVLFSSMIFTNIGVNFASWIMGKLLGFA